MGLSDVTCQYSRRRPRACVAQVPVASVYEQRSKRDVAMAAQVAEFVLLPSAQVVAARRKHSLCQAVYLRGFVSGNQKRMTRARCCAIQCVLQLYVQGRSRYIGKMPSDAEI